MCCTADLATLSDTIIYAGQQVLDGQRVQVLAYQNKANSTGPNAMILPIPTDLTLGLENLVCTREGGHFLQAISQSLGPQFSLNSPIGATAMQPAKVLDVGSYTVVLAESLAQVSGALASVPENKRPQFSSEFLAGYGQLYPDHRFIVGCWEGELTAEPIMLWWVPRDERLFVPTMDAHDGRPPSPGRVYTDHVIIIGVEEGGQPVEHIPGLDAVPDVIKRLLAPQLRRYDVPWLSPNGDSWFSGGSFERVTLTA